MILLYISTHRDLGFYPEFYVGQTSIQNDGGKRKFVIRKTNVILYVKNQQKSRDFYARVLLMQPALDVPGMTEFRISENMTLGLMPENGIIRLLGDKIIDPAKAGGAPRAELYLTTDDPEACHARAISAGALELKPFSAMNWGDMAAYSADPDGHILVFASTIKPS